MKQVVMKYDYSRIWVSPNFQSNIFEMTCFCQIKEKPECENGDTRWYSINGFARMHG